MNGRSELSDTEIKEEGDYFADLKNLAFRSVPHRELDSHGTKIYEWKYHALVHPDFTLGYIQPPSTAVRHIKRSEDQLIYDVTYSIDKFGRRIVPMNEDSARKKHLIIGGCSMSFGIGVNDDETFPYYLSQKLPEYEVYNYSVSGTGPNVLLALARSERLRREVVQREGVFIYSYLGNAHVDRALGKLPGIGWLQSTPYFEEDAVGSLIQNGSFESGRPITNSVLRTIDKLRILLGMNSQIIFPPISDSDTKFICKLFAESQRAYLQQFPQGKFLVYFHPSMNQGNETAIIPCLQESKVAYIEHKWLDGEKYPNIEFDGHPHPKKNRAIANHITEFLNDNSN